MAQADPWAAFPVATGGPAMAPPAPANGVPEIVVPNPTPPPPGRTPDQARLDTANASIAERTLAQGTPEQQDQRRQAASRAGDIEALSRQIDTVQGLYSRNFANQGLLTPTEYIPGLPANEEFNAAGASLGDLALAAFRVPGVGSQSDRELMAFVQANQPRAGDTDRAIQQKLSNLRNRVNERRRALGLEPWTWQDAPAQAPDEATDQNAAVTTPRAPAGTHVAFWDDPQQPAPPGGEQFQADVQDAINRGFFTTPEQIIEYGRNYRAPDGTARQFNIDRAQAEAAIRAVRSGQRVGVNPPRFESDISDMRGPEAEPGVVPTIAAGVVNNLTRGDVSPEQVDATVRGAADTLTVGGADYLSAVGDTLTGDGTFGENLYRERGIDAYDAANHPYARAFGQFSGALAIPSGVRGAAFEAAGRAYGSGARGAAVRIAARRGAANRMGLEGAAYSGAYGFNSSNADLSDVSGWLPQTAVSTVLGGGVAYGLGRGTGSLVDRFTRPGPVGRYADQLETAEIADAAQDRGIQLLPADVGGPFTRRLTAATAQTTFGASPVINAARRTIEQGGQARDAIANQAGNVVGMEAAGDVATAAARTFRTTSGRQGRGMYTRARNAADGVDIPPTNTMQTIAGLLREENQVPGRTAAKGVLQEYATAFEQGGPLTIDGARGLRTALRENLDAADMTPGNRDRIVNSIMTAVGQDIETALTRAGRPDAVRLYREADNFWRERAETLNDVIAPIVGRRFEASGEQVVQRLESAMRGNTDRIDRFIQALPAEEARTVRASLISRLGRANNSQQNAAGDAFSFETFLTNWNAMQPRAREAVFGREATGALNDLARIADRTRQAGAFANKPQTGGAVGLMFNLGTAAVNWPTFVMSAAAQYGLGRMLTAPVLVRWMTRAPANHAAARANVARLSDIARTHPAIAGEITGLQRSLSRQLESVGRSPATRAAAEQDEDVRREEP